MSDKIVSIAQPYIRTIVRRKANSPVESGAKIDILLKEQKVTINPMRHEFFNEGKYLEEQIKACKNLLGSYPEYALMDKIYLTRSIRTYLS